MRVIVDDNNEERLMLIERTVVCFNCKGSLAEPEDVPQRDRTPCPQCGSHERAVQVVTAGYIRTTDDLMLDFADDSMHVSGEALTAPNEIVGKQSHGAVQDSAVGSGTDELSQLVVVQREFSPDRNLYIEHVEDEATGATLWHVESSLSDHVPRLEGAKYSPPS